MAKDSVRSGYVFPAFHVKHDRNWDIPTELVTANKKVETKDKPTLRDFIGKTVGVIDTHYKPSLLVGFVTIEKEIIYRSEEEFYADNGRHWISRSDPESPFGWKGVPKYGYLLSHACRLRKPIPIPSESFTGDRTARDIAQFVSASDIVKTGLCYFDYKYQR